MTRKFCLKPSDRYLEVLEEDANGDPRLVPYFWNKRGYGRGNPEERLTQPARKVGRRSHEKR